MPWLTQSLSIGVLSILNASFAPHVYVAADGLAKKPLVRSSTRTKSAVVTSNGGVLAQKTNIVTVDNALELKMLPHKEAATIHESSMAAHNLSDNKYQFEVSNSMTSPYHENASSMTTTDLQEQRPRQMARTEVYSRLLSISANSKTKVQSSAAFEAPRIAGQERLGTGKLSTPSATQRHVEDGHSHSAAAPMRADALTRGFGMARSQLKMSNSTSRLIQRDLASVMKRERQDERPIIKAEQRFDSRPVSRLSHAHSHYGHSPRLETHSLVGRERRGASRQPAPSTAQIATGNVHSRSSATRMHVDGMPHSFGIKNDHFVWDDHPVVLRAGEVHYFRIPSAYWRDRLMRVKALGLNAISTYVPWNFHEQDEGIFDFSSEMHDVIGFLREAKSLGLPVVLRPGPYICAEWTGGGLPGWLQGKTGIELRTWESQYTKAIDRWWDKLLPLVRPELLENGGAVVMVQLENEFGTVGNTTDWKDQAYLEHLRDLAKRHLGEQTLLFTCDTPINDRTLRDGGLDGVFRATNLQADSIIDDKSWSKALAQQGRYNTKGRSPVYIAEMYTGWFTKFSDRATQRRPTDKLVSAIHKLLAENVSFSLYMAHGGTNFGFWAGANPSAMTTSYDYNAPIREDGGHGYGSDGIDKYSALRAVFGEYLDLPLESPHRPLLRSFGQVTPVRAASLHAELDGLCHSGWEAQRLAPRPMEFFGQTVGLAVYRYQASSVQAPPGDPARFDLLTSEPFIGNSTEMAISNQLSLNMSDESAVWVNGQLQSWYSPLFSPVSSDSRDTFLELELQPSSRAHWKQWTLDVLADSTGRRNWGASRKELQDTRGLWSARLDGVLLETGSKGHWSVCQLRFENVSALDEMAAKHVPVHLDARGPVFWAGKLEVKGDPGDTYLHFGEGWEKGIAFVNGFNLGRYNVGSAQKELYVPAPFLRRHTNSIVLLETGEVACTRQHMGNLSFLSQRESVF